MKLGLREILFVAGMLGLLACSYFCVLRKLDAKRMALDADTRTKTVTLANLKQMTSGINDLNQKIEELQQAIVFFESKLPQEQEVDEILREVTQLAEANGLTNKAFHPMKNDRGPRYSEKPIQMTLMGDFKGFYLFLQQLEKLPRLTRVTQMDLQKINDHEGQMTAKMTLSIFFEPQAAEADSR